MWKPHNAEDSALVMDAESTLWRELLADKGKSLRRKQPLILATDKGSELPEVFSAGSRPASSAGMPPRTAPQAMPRHAHAPLPAAASTPFLCNRPGTGSWPVDGA